MARRRILIVEDDAISRRLYATVLREEFTDVDVVDVAKIALGKARIADGDLWFVITDIRLPDGDGREILAAVRASAMPATPVIAVSGMMASEAQELHELGFDHVLVKPVELATLRATCRQIAANSADSPT